MRYAIACLGVLVIATVAWSQATRPAQNGRPGDSAGPATRPGSDPDLMLKQLLSGNRPKAPLEPVDLPPEKGTDRNVTSVVPPRNDQYTVIREGTYLIDRIGRLTKTAEGQNELTLESDGSGLKDPPLIILPNQNLGLMEMELRRSSRDLKFRVSGLITEYNNRNYILVEKMIVMSGETPNPITNPPKRSSNK
jgi:hypothetical protein